MMSRYLLKIEPTKEWVYSICSFLFKAPSGEPIVLAETQCEIIADIVFNRKPRVLISCMTRYGKSEAISIGLILSCMLSDAPIINWIVAPTDDLARVIMRYVGKHILDHEYIIRMVDMPGMGGIERVRKEVSKSRITWVNGCSIEIVTADIGNNGRALLGKGGDRIFGDEVESIPVNIVEEKIMRMTGDRPGQSQIMLLSNPLSRGFMHKHWNDRRWHKYHVGWEQAIKEGRTTKAHIDDMREVLKNSPQEFKIWYESDWPEEGYQDQLISWVDIENAKSRVIDIATDPVKETVLGVDVATRGTDLCVFWTTHVHESGIYSTGGIKTLERSDTIDVVNMIITLDKAHNYSSVRIDYTGNGEGVVDTLKRYPDMKKRVHGVIMGERPIGDENKRRYVRKKDWYYWHVRELFMNNLVVIPDHEYFVNNLASFGYNILPNGKIDVQDPQERKKKGYNIPDKMNSPDFSDAFVFSVCPIPKGHAYVSAKARVQT